jgi:hypothetical protein
MQRARLVVLVLLLATFLAPQRSSAAATIWQPWDLLRQWLGGERIAGRCSADPLGGCQPDVPGAAQPQAGSREVRPISSPVRHPGVRIQCGAIPDPMGGCIPNAPIHVDGEATHKG